jgi:hypothetical protein
LENELLQAGNKGLWHEYVQAKGLLFPAPFCARFGGLFAGLRSLRVIVQVIMFLAGKEVRL